MVAFFQGALKAKNVKWVWISLSEAGDPFGPMERPLDDAVLTFCRATLTSNFDLRKNKLLVLKGIDHWSISLQFVQTKKRMQDLQPVVTLCWGFALPLRSTNYEVLNRFFPIATASLEIWEGMTWGEFTHQNTMSPPRFSPLLFFWVFLGLFVFY